MTTAMWSNKPPITGARINGTRERPGIAACFNDKNGKPFALQLEPNSWLDAMKVLGFKDTLEAEGLLDLGLAFESENKKTEILNKLAELFSTNERDHWISILRKADKISTHVNTMLEASSDPNIVNNNYVTEVWYPELNKNLKEITAVYKNGFSEEEDVEQIKLSISKLRTQFKYAKESYKLSFDILKLLLGVELDQKLNLSDSLEYLTMKNLNYESIDSNYSNNIDIRLAENKVIEEKFLFRLEKAKRLTFIERLSKWKLYGK